MKMLKVATMLMACTQATTLEAEKDLKDKDT
jgi:hypothetical protein